MPTLISAAVWVPQGAAARHPRKQDLSDPAELERVERLGKVKLDQARAELEAELDRIEGGVDGMQVDGDEGDDDENDDGEGSGNDDDEADWQDEDSDDADPTAKARSMQATIKRAAKVKTSGQAGDPEDVDKLYKLDTYDQERSQTASLGIFSSIRGLAFHPGGDEADPYVTLEDPAREDAELEREELEILPTDNLIVCAKTANDVSLLETHVYENYDYDDSTGNNAEAEGGNLYAHHDALLPDMPLCLEWGDCRPSTSKGDAKGSFVAVGTMDKHIEIWDLDVVDGLIPEAILGDDTEDHPTQQTQQQQSSDERFDAVQDVEIDNKAQADTAANGQSGKKKKKKKSKKSNGSPEHAPLATLPHAHTDSVLSLSWNRVHRSLLVSASADTTIKLWDLQSPTCQKAIRSFSVFGQQKVQSVSWNPVEATVLLAGAWGGDIQIFDTRTPDARLGCTLTMQADVEALHWDPHGTANAQFYAASGKGQVTYWDSRHLSKPIWMLDAHDGPVSSLDVNEFIPGCIVTGGIDNQVKVWSIGATAGAQSNGSLPKTTTAATGSNISLVHNRDFGVGKVFSTVWSPDDPTLVALAGSAAKLSVWDAFTNPGFRRTFGERLRNLDGSMFAETSRRARGQGVVRLEDDGEAYESD